MTYDERSLSLLTEESQDLQSDALTTTKEALDEFVDVSHETGTVDDAPSSGAYAKAVAGALIAGGFGIAVTSMFQTAAAASTMSTDVEILQTAASIEVLAISTYGKALTLPFIGGSSANKVVKAFAQTTKGQHAQHLQAFNGAISQLGGKKQTKPDPKYLKVVTSALPTLKAPADVVKLAHSLELVAAETYVNDCTLLKSESARKVMASIMGVEAQHVAVLDAVAALLGANAPQLITLSPGNAANLPSVAGSVGIPYSFWPTSGASPASEGAMK